MQSATAISFPRFNGKKADYPRFRRLLLAALRRTGASIFAYGVLPFAISEEERMETYPEAPEPVARNAPAVDPPMGAVMRANWEYSTSRYLAEQAAFSAAIEGMLGTLSPEKREDFELEQAQDPVTPASILAYMDTVFGKLTTAELVSEGKKLSLPFSSTADFEEHLRTHAAVHEHYRRSSSALPNVQKMSHLIDGLRHLPHPTVQHIITAYDLNEYAEYNTLANKLKDAMALATVRAEGLTAANQGYAAAAITPIPPQAILEETIARCVQAAFSQYMLVANKMPTATNDDAQRLPYYCYSCGENYTHNGDTCRRPREGHKAQATYDTRGAGGSTARAREPRRRKEKKAKSSRN